MDDVVAVGEVPDEVLLLCGAPGSDASRWWTPTLADCDRSEVRERVTAAREVLDELGVRDAATGALHGLLGEVADVVTAAELVVLLEAADDGRRAVVVAPERALLDRQSGGVHDLLLAAPSAAVGLLAELLWTGVEPNADVMALAGRRTPEEVAEVLPLAERTTTSITRTVVGRGVHLVTVLASQAGSIACWALPEGDIHVQVLDEAGAVDLALLLLGAEPVEVAA